MKKTKLMLGDNMKSLKKLPENSIDSVVTDPPYGLSFMNKKWDYDVPSVDFWREVFRVLKPGGHILSFGGTRTNHRMTVNIEDAGFEIRDQIQWIYAQGFPKSHNISKKIEQDIDNLIYNNIWKSKLDNVKIVEQTLKKSQTEVGNNMEKQSSVQENVVLIDKEKSDYQNVIAVERNFTEAHLILKENPIVQESVGQFLIPQQDLVKCVEQLSEDQIVKLLNIFIVEESVKDMLKELLMSKIKVEEVQKTLNGNEKFSVLEIIPVLCVVLPKILKHIILSQSRTFQNLDMKLQMDCVSATSVIITKSIMEHLIGNTVGILRKRIDFTIDNGHSALKPANEPICLARKPLSEKSVAENVLKWKTGGINVDGCRVGSDMIQSSLVKPEKNTHHNYTGTDESNALYDEDGRRLKGEVNEGRFPANIILECLCDEVIKGEKGEIIENGGSGGIWNEGTKEPVGRTYNDKGDIHTNPMCPCFMMDEQSGVSKSSKGLMKSAQSGNDEGRYNWNNGDKNDFESVRGHNDKGGASRFFYQAKVSKAERNMGLDGFEETTTDAKGNGIDRVCMNEGCGVSMLKPELCNCESPDWRVKPKKNHHPTVKPVSLMAYLCRLITPPNGIVLDPFMGSGSTGIAAQLEGFRFCGMEMDPDYFKIAETRIENWEKYKKFIK
jgi:DNA modification methylase